MRRAVLINGVPASGKTTLCRKLTDALVARDIAVAPFSLDTVKEALFAHLGHGDRDHNRLLGRASYEAIFACIGELPDTVIPIVEAWHGFQPEEVLRAHLDRARITDVVQVWCQVSPETAARRYRSRDRHPGHPPASYADELSALARNARPYEIGDIHRVTTEGDIDAADLEGLLRRIGHC
jgi:glucokinase